MTRCASGQVEEVEPCDGGAEDTDTPQNHVHTNKANGCNEDVPTMDMSFGDASSAHICILCFGVAVAFSLFLYSLFLPPPTGPRPPLFLARACTRTLTGTPMKLITI